LVAYEISFLFKELGDIVENELIAAIGVIALYRRTIKFYVVRPIQTGNWWRYK
jgi:hypothetical protein